MKITKAELQPYTTEQIASMRLGDDADNLDFANPQYRVRARDEINRLCERLECELVERESDQVLLDLDTSVAVEMFKVRLSEELFKDMFPGAQLERAWKSRSGVGYHVVVNLNRNVDDTDAAVIESFLGSDPKRALLILRERDVGAEVMSACFRPIGAKDLTLLKQLV